MRRFLILLLIIGYSLLGSTQNVTQSLNGAWQFRQSGTEKWYKAEVPGTVHTDLLSNKLIPDPFHRDNESKVQWVEEKSWDYQLKFDVQTSLFNKGNIEIEFDGLDTYASVHLNGEELMKTDNMFRQWTADIKPYLKQKGNLLQLRFLSSSYRAKNKKSKEKILLPDNERVFVRKAQYQFGWDWGPRLVTCGIWKDVRLVGWNNVRIRDVFISPTNTVWHSKYDSNVHVLNAAAVIESVHTLKKVEILMVDTSDHNDLFFDHGGPWHNNKRHDYVGQNRISLKKGINLTDSLGFAMRRFQQWQPGSSQPHIYTMRFSTRFVDGEWRGNENYDAVYEQSFGPRDIKLVTQKDSIGESFYFTVNGKPTFIKGSNWIPAESFLPRAKKQKRYEQLIKAAKEANINMLRVWGGGIYEDDVFYDLCDQYGIMVWQDFMFAGALYPADSAFLKNIEEEVRYQVKRLRNHPCIAIWCGNNEIEEAWFNWGWQKQFNYSAEDSTKLWNDYKKIFHQLIPDVLKELDPQRPYRSSSPSLGWGRDSAYKKGDVHYWGVWWGKEPVEKYNDKVGRFVSEYGMQGMPDMKTIKQFSLPPDWDTSSAVMKAHQKHPFGWENIKYYIEQKFRTPKTFEDLVYVSELMQADAIKTAIEAHRRNKPATMGTMFWQWNDCWPVTSWSAVDYYGRKKALWYEVKRDYQNLVVLPSVDSNYYHFKIVSELDSNITVKLETDFISFIKPERNVLKSQDKFVIKSNGTFSARSGRDISREFPNDGCMRFRIVSNGKTIAENFLFLSPPKTFNLPKVNVDFTIVNNSIELMSKHFAYGVFIDVPDGVELEDNYFHLLPNEKKIVKFTSTIPIEAIRKSIKIKSLVDTYQP